MAIDNTVTLTGTMPQTLHRRDRSLLIARIDTATAVTRFWSMVDQPDAEGNRLWLGPVTDKGYGRFYWDGLSWPAHEMALTFATGEVRATGMETCHSCDLPLCCEPAHLRFDTHAENMADSARRGRYGSVASANNGHRKLTVEDVVLIRERRVLGATTVALGSEYGVNPAQITKICAGRSWKHAPGPITEVRTRGH